MAPITGTPTEGPTTYSTSCPDGSSTDEGEGYQTSSLDTFNGGCSNFGRANAGGGFSNITFGESICGTTVSNCVDNGGIFRISDRDRDWYYFKVSMNTTVSVRLTTDFDAYLGSSLLATEKGLRR